MTSKNNFTQTSELIRFKYCNLNKYSKSIYVPYGDLVGHDPNSKFCHFFALFLEFGFDKEELIRVASSRQMAEKIVKGHLSFAVRNFIQHYGQKPSFNQQSMHLVIHTLIKDGWLPANILSGEKDGMNYYAF